MILKDTISITLDNKYLDMNKMAIEVIEQLQSDGKEAYIKSEGAMPIICIDNVDYGLTAGAASGALVSEQKAILRKV